MSGATRHSRALGRAWFQAALLLVALAAAPHARAQEQGGGTAGPFGFGPTARGISLGASMAVLGEDASAPFWNPALLHRAPITELQFSHNRLAGGPDAATLQYLGVVVPTLGAGGFGLALLRVGAGGIQGYDEFSRPTETLDYSQTQLLLSYGTGVRLPKLGGGLDIGLGAKVHRLQLGDTATSGGLDLGLAFHPPRLPRLALAVAYQDLIAPSFRLIEQEDQLPHITRYAASYRVMSGPGASLRLAAALTREQYAGTGTALAAELRLPQGLSARLGVTEGRVGIGAGGRWKAYALDYAYQGGNELGASHYFTLTWTLGQTIEARREHAALIQRQQIAAATQEGVRAWLAARADSSLRRAEQLLSAGDPAGAERELERANGFGASPEQLDSLRTALATTRARAAQDSLSLRERTTRAEEAADQVRLALDQNDPLRARTALDRLEQLAPDHPLLASDREQVTLQLETAAARRAELARASERDGDRFAALNAWSEVLQFAPGDSVARREMARLRDDFDSAHARADAAARQLALQRQYTDALQAFADGDPQRALALAQAILAAHPEFTLAKTLAQRAERALQGPARLTVAQEGEVRRLYLAGLEQFTAGRYADAIAQWQQILAIDPENQGAESNIREARTRMLHLEDGKAQGQKTAAQDGGGP